MNDNSENMPIWRDELSALIEANDGEIPIRIVCAKLGWPLRRPVAVSTKYPRTIVHYRDRECKKDRQTYVDLHPDIWAQKRRLTFVL